MSSFSQRFIAQGIEQGVGLGICQGEARGLLRQIEAKFGPDAAIQNQDRVMQASEAELLHWLERILTAESVESIFEE